MASVICISPFLPAFSVSMCEKISLLKIYLPTTAKSEGASSMGGFSTIPER